MSNSSPPPMQRACSIAQPVKRPLSVKYTEECHPMRLSEAEKYFGLHIVKVFCVSEGVYSPKGSEGLAKGGIFVVCLKKPVSFLKVRSAVPSPGKDSVTIPVITRTEFALAPLSEEDDHDERDAAIKSWEGEYQSVTEFLDIRKYKSLPMPAALKVLCNAVDHNKQKIPTNTTIFNIRKVSPRVGLQKRHGIEGVDHSGTVYCFLECGDPLRFSTRLYDVKCLPIYFKNVLQLPQMARVYLHPNMEEEEEGEENSLQNLSTVTITDIIDGHDQVVRKLSDSGDELGPTFTIPWNADLKVVAVKLRDSHILDAISKQRCINPVKAKNPNPNPAPSDSMVTVVKMASCETDKTTRVEHISRERSLPALPLPLLPLIDEYDRHHGTPFTSSLGEEGLYEEIQQVLQNKGSSGSTPLSQSTTSTVHEEDGAAGPPPLIERKMSELNANISTGGYVSMYVPHYPKVHGHSVSVSEKEQIGTAKLDGSLSACRGNETLPTTTVVQGSLRGRCNTAPPHRKPSPRPTRRYTTGNGSDLEKSILDGNLDFKHHPSQRMSSSPMCRTNSCARPTEPDLRYHVAAKLGRDWRSVGTYLGLQHWQLDQADWMDSKLEEKAMEALVMWLRGQGDSEEPRSWETVLKALRLAGQNEMATKLERNIRDRRLLQSEQHSSTHENEVF